MSTCREGLHYCPNCDRSIDVAAMQGLQERVKELEGDDLHPENKCARCGGKNIVWHADSELWNRYADRSVILCPICFAKACEPDITLWVLSPRRFDEAQALKQEQTLPPAEEAKQAEDYGQGREQRVPGESKELNRRADRLQADRDSWQKQAEIQAESLRTAQSVVEQLLLERDRLQAEVDKWTRMASCAGFDKTGLLAVGEELAERDKKIVELQAEVERMMEPIEPRLCKSCGTWHKRNLELESELIGTIEAYRIKCEVYGDVLGENKQLTQQLADQRAEMILSKTLLKVWLNKWESAHFRDEDWKETDDFLSGR